MLTLYHYLDCPYCFKVRMYLEERAIAWQSAVVDRKAPPPELSAMSPLGRLPVLVNDEGRPIFGSTTIIDYLEAWRPEGGLLPADPLARARCWMANEMAEVGLLVPLMALDTHQRKVGEAALMDPALVRREQGRVRHQLKVFEALLGGRLWLVGDRLTVAEIALTQPLAVIERYGIDLAETPALADLARRLDSRDSARRARRQARADDRRGRA